MAELSKNQISGGTPVRAEDEKKETSNQYSAPVKQDVKLPSGDKVDKYKEPMPDAIDSRVDVSHLLNFLQESVQNSVDARRDWQDKLETWYKQYKGGCEGKEFPMGRVFQSSYSYYWDNHRYFG